MDLIKTEIKKITGEYTLETCYLLQFYVRIDSLVEVKSFIGSEGYLYEPITFMALDIQTQDVYCEEITKQTVVHYLKHIERLFSQAQPLTYEDYNLYLSFDLQAGEDLINKHGQIAHAKEKDRYVFKNMAAFIITKYQTAIKSVHCEIGNKLFTPTSIRNESNGTARFQTNLF